jgi:hypothetical protein
MSIQQADVEVLEAAIQGIHQARLDHPILSIMTTRTDSVVLARAALDAIRSGGFKIVRAAEPEASRFNDS